MFVKICGITRLEDAEAAVEAGAGAIGFGFWPKSPRLIDPNRARAIAARLLPFVTPDNVAEAIAQVRPFGIDVSSGVERAPGIKDHQRLRALFEAVHDTGHITTRS